MIRDSTIPSIYTIFHSRPQSRSLVATCDIVRAVSSSRAGQAKIQKRTRGIVLRQNSNDVEINKTEATELAYTGTPTDPTP